MIKVILNCLPPARVDTPSAALSILKAHLVQHGIETDVLYWNLLLDRVPPHFERNTDAIHLDLLPYLYLIAGEYGDDIAQSKANAYVKARLPERDILNDSSDYLRETGKALDETFGTELSRYSADNRLLFGISCKYEQWIPGIVLAKYVKRFLPDSRIVIGGLGNRDKAMAIMKVCSLFDFAIWGEGEYPLLQLCRALDSKHAGLDRIPRLLFREGNCLSVSHMEAGDLYDMNSRVFADHDDYFACLEALGRGGSPVILPLESTRGCTWNACRFCVYSDGCKARKKEPAVLMDEIGHLLDRYGTPYFAFMDNDIVANDHGRLEAMLDGLISIREHREIHFIAEVIHKGFTGDIMEKLPRAGFGRIHFGYESLSDRLLAKMKKRTNFSDNIFFVKFARKFGIRLPSANIICGVPGEEDMDVLECIDNLHFLRFYFDKDFFRHNIIPLRLAGHSEFHAMVPEEELVRFDENEIFHLLPREMTRNADRFSLFDFSSPHRGLWDVFASLNDFYYSHVYSYGIHREEDRIIYRELFDGEPVVELLLGDLAHRVLQAVNARIVDLGGLLESLREHDGVTDRTPVLAILDFLKARHLVYFNEAYRSIVSVIDTDA